MAARKPKMPTPRLQLRWEKVAEGEWKCNYELVIKLGKLDIRNPQDYKRATEKLIPLSSGTMVQSTRGPVWPDGTVDTPFRDGAHARWDAEQLGNPPIYAVYEDKFTRLKDLDKTTAKPEVKVVRVKVQP